MKRRYFVYGDGRVGCGRSIRFGLSGGSEGKDVQNAL